MTVEKITSDYIVLESGTVQTFAKNSSMTFNFGFDNAFQMSIVIEFKQVENEKYKLENRIDGNKIIFTCYNFDNALGTGTTNPLSVATYKGKSIYFSFWVYALGQNAMKKIDYCLYQAI